MGKELVEGLNGTETIVASNYQLLPLGCRIGNGLGISVLFATFLVIATLIARMQTNFAKERQELLMKIEESSSIDPSLIELQLEATAPA